MRTTILQEQIPDGHVMLLFWVRTEHDSRDTASSTGHTIIPAKGCLKAAHDLDFHGDDQLGAAAGHGVTILWKSGRQREVRAFD